MYKSKLQRIVASSYFVMIVYILKSFKPSKLNNLYYF
jgi:hypothetical protein